MQINPDIYTKFIKTAAQAILDGLLVKLLQGKQHYLSDNSIKML